MQVGKRQRRRSSLASSIVETTAGLFLLIPVAIFLCDVMALVIVQTANDALAKHAARAAAEKADDATAKQAAKDIIATFPTTGLYSAATFVDSGWSYDVTQVHVQTQLTCNFPFPVPFCDQSGHQLIFDAEATEPNLALLSPN